MNWLSLTDEQRRSSINQAVLTVTGITQKAIEKDWWVTLVLRVLFSSKHKEHILFKGGTSLSKCFGLIDRFSEDIDLVLKRDFLGFEGIVSKNKIGKLRSSAATFAISDLIPMLEEDLVKSGVPEGIINITAKPEKDKQSPNDPQIIYIKYPSLYPPVSYIKDEVQVEVSARSLIDPYTSCTVNSILSTALSTAPFAEQSFEVPAVEPKRTFLEKAFLMHEEFQQPADAQDPFRKSRHFYDLERMMDQPFAEEVLKDEDLYQKIIDHRKHFNTLSGIDYASHARKTISFYPPEYAIENYRSDYATMRTEMIHGDKLTFEELMVRIAALQKRFRNE